MTVPTTIDPAAWLSKYLEGADGDQDLARAMLKAFAEAIMSAQASMQCGAGYGERTDERENSRNGYRTRRWDTRVGTIEALAVPTLRRGSTAPSPWSPPAGGPNRPSWRSSGRPTWPGSPPAGSTSW